MLKQMGSITESIGVLECLSKPLNVFQDLSHSLQSKAMRKIASMASIFLSFQVLSKKRPQMEDISASNKDIWTSGVFDDDVMGRGRNEIGFNFVSSHFIVVVFTIVVFIVFIVVVFVFVFIVFFIVLILIDS